MLPPPHQEEMDLTFGDPDTHGHVDTVVLYILHIKTLLSQEICVEKVQTL